MSLKEQLAESKQQLHDAYQDRIAALKDLLLHTVGQYEANSAKAWTRFRQQPGMEPNFE